MQFNLLQKKNIQITPTIIHSLQNKIIVVCYKDGQYEFLTNDEYPIIQTNVPATCAINLSDNTCLFGLTDGNGALLTLNKEIQEIKPQIWRDKVYSIQSQAIISMGKINDTQICIISNDGQIIVVQELNETIFSKIKTVHFPIPINAAFISNKMFIIGCNNELLGFQSLEKVIEQDKDKLKLLAFNQLKVLGQNRFTLDELWQQKCQIQGDIYKLLVNDTQLIVLSKGYFSILSIDQNPISFTIEKIIEIGYNRPIQLNLVNKNLIHISYEGSQLMLYDVKTQLLRRLQLKIREDKQLIASLIQQLDDKNSWIVVAYRFKPSIQQEMYPPIVFSGKINLIMQQS